MIFALKKSVNYHKITLNVLSRQKSSRDLIFALEPERKVRIDCGNELALDSLFDRQYNLFKKAMMRRVRRPLPHRESGWLKTDRRTNLKMVPE